MPAQNNHQFVRLSPMAREAFRQLARRVDESAPKGHKILRQLPRGVPLQKDREGFLILGPGILFHQPLLRQANQTHCPTNGDPVLRLVTRPADGNDPDAFLAELREFNAHERATQEAVVDGMPYFTNAFWSAAQRAGHSLQEVPYRASFKPELPDFFIERLSRPGMTVHDPFAGRGTVLLAAVLAHRRATASDISPLTSMLIRPRLRPVCRGMITDTLRSIDWTAGRITRPDLLTFYHEDTLRQIEALRTWLHRHADPHDPFPSPVADWIRMAALTRLTGHSSGYMSVRTLPPNQMVTVERQAKINASKALTPPPRNLADIIAQKTRALLKDGCVPPDAQFQLETGAAWETPWLRTGSVDLAVTSPPFGDVVDYGHETWLRGWFAGIDTSKIPFAHHRSLTDWAAMIRRTLGELARVLRPGGHVALEVGEIRRGSVDLAWHVWRAASGLPFLRLGVMVHDQRFSKSSQIYGVTNNDRGTNSNRVVILRRT